MDAAAGNQVTMKIKLISTAVPANILQWDETKSLDIHDGILIRETYPKHRMAVMELKYDV